MYPVNRFGEVPDRQVIHAMIEERMQDFKALHLLAIITARSKGKEVIDILRTKKMPGQYVFHAKGTATSAVLDLLGLGSEEKTVTLGFAISKTIPALLCELDKELKLTKNGTGIAFSVPLSGIIMPSPTINHDIMAKWQNKFESEAEQVNIDLTHDLIIVMVNEGRCEEVIEAAHNAGATGGTTFHALHFGRQDVARFFGIAMQGKKDVVTILAKREHKLDIMTAINDALGATPKIIFSLPADNVIGLDGDSYS